MKFLRDFGFLEFFFILSFFCLSALALYRVYRINDKLQHHSFRLVIKFILRTSYFALLLIALLAPSFGDQKREVKSEGKDIFLVVDLSRSMDAVDIQPSRLGKIKFELKKIISQFSSDRIGLIVFTSEAFLQCPLTFDHNALLNLFISPLNTNQIYNKGTDFAPALKMALNKHLAEEKQQVKKKTSKIILLVSDGEDFGESITTITNEIKQQGIKLYTLGIGTQSGGKIPDGYRFKRDKTGGDVVTKLNSKSLKDLADMTGGDYFEIGKNRNDVNRLITSIGNVKGEFRASQFIDASSNKYYYFLGVAFILMLIDVLITVKVVKL